jgi:hypothetical protein
MKNEIHTITVMTVTGSEHEFNMNTWKVNEGEKLIRFIRKDKSIDITFSKKTLIWIKKVHKT